MGRGNDPVLQEFFFGNQGQDALVTFVKFRMSLIQCIWNVSEAFQPVKSCFLLHWVQPLTKVSRPSRSQLVDKVPSLQK